ncbi:hypothetical protein Q4Q35_09370 [Flavivirga aquimarina]|uniref:DNA-binding protein n=1 Tax=Flavivirga aquimarina TaxID=2027862 RepID=A0ABT8WA52_9FLAO|nr:hypothetical protein [Flavivirga aquimarina]MDO5970018.1 hypothetical protein [Flavivirga aquimarina]
MTYVTCEKGHLVCVPYSIENLHQMAKELKIEKHCFHKGRYVIPKPRIEEIEKRCKVVSHSVLDEIIIYPKYASIIIEDEIPKIGAVSSDHFLQTQIEYNGRKKSY